MFDNNISIDTTYNTLYTGYDTLNRVLNTAESLEANGMHTIVITDNTDDWLDYQFDVIEPDSVNDDFDYNEYDAIIIEVNDDTTSIIRNAIDSGSLVIGYAHDNAFTDDAVYSLFDRIDDKWVYIWFISTCFVFSERPGVILAILTI